MESNCQNCQTLIVNNFCDNCGQKKFKKIDKKYITDEIQYTFLHTNKGLLYSLKNVIKNPGKTAREFIDGNRVNHYKPILLVFLLSGISTFISFKIIHMNELMMDFYTRKHMISDFMIDYVNFTTSYNSVVMLLMVPIFAITTRLAFRKWGHNYYEHVVMNAYILSFYTLFIIFIISPILYLTRDNMEIFNYISMASMLTVPFILVWFFKEFYNDKPTNSVVGRSILSIVLLGAIILILMIILILVMIGFVIVNGPEAMQYFKSR